MIKKERFEKERFVELNNDTFDCLICSCVADRPRQCGECGAIFCQACINDWINKKQKQVVEICPNRCFGQINPLISKALIKMYNNLDIKCKFFNKCNQIVKLSDLDKHEENCIENGYYCNESFSNQPFYNLKKLQQMLKVKQQNAFKWNKATCGKGIAIYGEEQNNAFYISGKIGQRKSVIAAQPFMSGINYWEIIIDDNSTSDIFVGITTSNWLDCQINFSTQQFGYGYHQLGLQVTDYLGNKTCKGKIGICVDMNKGTLSFSFNDQYIGATFKNKKFCRGPIYPAVCLNYYSNCSIIGPLECPPYLLDI